MTTNCCLSEIIDTSHPIMKGITYWFYPTDKLVGSSYAYDVVGQNHATIDATSQMWNRASRSYSKNQLTFTSNELVTAGDVLSQAGDFTIGVWCSQFGSVGKSDISIVSRGLYAGGTNYVIGMNGTSNLFFRFRDSLGNPLTAVGPVLTANTWTHIVGTHSRTGGVSTINLYIDGVLSATASDTILPYSSSGQSFNIGSYDSNIQNWKGAIDDVNVFDVELSSTRVSDLYKESKIGYPNVVIDQSQKVYLLGTSGSGTYSHVPTGGILGAGTATSTAKYSPTITGSALCASSAILGVFSSPAITGSALGAGSSSMNIVVSFTPSGGVKCNGEYVEYEIGGAKLNSSATVAVNYAIVASAGASIGSSAIAQATYNGKNYVSAFSTAFDSGFQIWIPDSSGVLLNSSARNVLVVNPSVSGGIKANSSAVVVVRYRPVSTSGAVLNSTARVVSIYRNIATGGALAASSALVLKMTNTIASGGSLAASSATMEFIYIPVISGSALLSGLVNDTISKIEIVSGGALAGSSAATGYGYIPFGGATAASSANVRVLYSVNGSGGAIANGLAQRTLVVSIGSYGVACVGTATVACVYNSIPTGGLLANSSAIMFRIYAALTVTGGALANGSAILLKVSAYILANPAGVKISGLVETNVTAESILTGRLLLSGQSNVVYVAAPEKILTYHQFGIGETAYFVVVSQGVYLKKKIQQIYVLGQTVFYETTNGELIAENLLISLEECRIRTKGRSVFAKPKTRKRSILNPLPDKFTNSHGLYRRVI